MSVRNFRFYRTYEGLKLLYVVRGFVEFHRFYRTYEGLKPKKLFNPL
ncbi:hypothetical protein B4113_1663 [Geobacillus sp. B4113_201601]|nr:hypothetical protein B4113_1663 [Geobacillus sp. B4113_201601]